MGHPEALDGGKPEKTPSGIYPSVRRRWLEVLAPSIRVHLLEILDQIEEKQGKPDLFSQAIRETLTNDGIPKGVDPELADVAVLRGAAIQNVLLRAAAYHVPVDAELKRRVEKILALER
jgi:hypothetical protein